MIEISYKTQPDLYFDFRETLKYLSKIDMSEYEYPEEVTPFHVYTEVRTEKELECIKSYLATQNLEKTKLIVWSDYSIEDNPLIQPYKEYIDLRIYNPHEIAKETPLEGLDTYLTPSEDNNHWMNSGILRFLVVYKVGGIYADQDMVLLRDFKPILQQDFAYQWGSSVDFAKEHPNSGDCMGPCAAMIGAKKGGAYIENCIQTLIKTPVRPGTTCFDEDMLGKVYRIDPDGFTVFPSPFFNAEWLISKVDPTLRTNVINSWFINNGYAKDNLFLESFAWHWHNSNNRNKVVEKGSKFDMLRDITNNRLKEKGIL